MNKRYRAIFLSLLLISGMMPAITRALFFEAHSAKKESFEQSFAKAGFEFFSALDASIDIITHVARDTYHRARKEIPNDK